MLGNRPLIQLINASSWDNVVRINGLIYSKCLNSWQHWQLQYPEAVDAKQFVCFKELFSALWWSLNVYLVDSCAVLSVYFFSSSVVIICLCFLLHSGHYLLILQLLSNYLLISSAAWWSLSVYLLKSSVFIFCLSLQIFSGHYLFIF